MPRIPVLGASLLSLMALPPAAFAQSATAELVGNPNAGGENIAGTATFTQTPSGTIHILVDGRGFPPGPHAVHVHEAGICDTASGFESAAGHVADGLTHGLAAEEGPHPGDLPNLHAQEDGIIRAEFFTRGFTLEQDEGLERIFDDDGSSIVVHTGADDYRSQPSGDSGDRLACGVIEPDERQ
ncbi:MAG: superoxide dismutase family protein [Rhizobiaceae bacterium]|nr:superoxide dismutase family protein [Rhizobiaceae bacterium]MCV0407489.1 superoxide dismutase family protein [Rhizobiaceae bacterium]